MVKISKKENNKMKLRRSKQDDSSDEDSDNSSSSWETADSDDDDEEETAKRSTNKKKNKKRRVDSDDEEDSEEEEEEEEEESDDEEDIEESEDEEDEEDSDYEEDDEDEDEDEEDESISRDEIQDLIAEIFPSRYIRDKKSKRDSEAKLKNKKTKKKNEKKTKKKNEKKSKKNDEKKSKKSKKSKNSKKASKKQAYETDSDDSEYLPDEDDEEDIPMNFVFQIGGDYDDEDPEDYNDEDDDADVNSDDEAMFMKENYVEQEKKETKKKKKEKKQSEDEVELTDVEQEYLDMIRTKKHLLEQLNKDKKNKVMKKMLSTVNESIKKLVKKARTQNAKSYHKLIHSDKKRLNEIEYFKKKLSNKEQLRAMRELKEINKNTINDKPYRLRLLDTKIPPKFKAIAMQKLSMLKNMEPTDGEYFKIKNWVDAFMKIPFGIYKSLSIKMEDGPDKCYEYMKGAYDQLDKCVYGLNDAKMQIMQMVGQWISNPSAMGTAIAIKGPMGTGKTTLVKEGISQILGREFDFIALGGTGDSSFLEGHSYTYEGSVWGKIVQILMNSKCMNPVIYFDELDKISDTPKGEEITGILTHLTDTTQNSQFHDKYFSEVDFDLSKCLFIFSYNDESRVNPILKDRMYCIQTKGYEVNEKITIAQKYLLPKIREQVNFGESDIIIPDETIKHIISTEYMTKRESGVRNLKRCLEIVHTKLNLYRLMKTETKLFNDDLEIDVQFPMTVSKDVVEKLIKNDEKQNQSLLAMYV
jgi:hypothetical protein